MSDVIGIIGGTGVVGAAIVNACERELISTIIADEYTVLSPGNNTFDRLMQCDAIFVCVPSPMILAGADTGKCDSSILESVLSKLEGFNGVIISKVTAPPDVYTRLGAKYKNLTYSPEFLTAANAATDYYEAEFFIVSGTVKAYINEAERIVSKTQAHATTFLTSTMEEAALMKYAINSFLATKVIFMNELYELAKANNIDYDAVALLFNEDVRTGRTHVKVPSPMDNTFGFGGMCFPKDTNALLKYAENANIELSVLEAAVKKNTLLRLKDK